MVFSPATAPPETVAIRNPSKTSRSLVHSGSPSARVLADRTNKGIQDVHPEVNGDQRKLRIPSVIVDTENISNAMAARLATSLVSHVLFLKSQIPFPVAQLARMPAGPSNARASKKRDELISSVDTLSSHLITTFSALSLAFAQRGTPSHLEFYNENSSIASTESVRPPTVAHMAIVLGSSVGAAKARVMLVLDGLDVKEWDEKEKESISRSPSPSLADSEEPSDSDSVASDNDREDGPQDSGEPSDSDSGSGPPSSRSVSPCGSEDEQSYSHRSFSLPPTLPPLTAKFVPFRESPSAPSPSSSTKKPSLLALRESPLRSSASISRQCPVPQSYPPQPIYEEEQQTLRAADRLLSRTLASDCAEDDGGLSADLPPTQMHILLRAPRRFRHPAWTPRQNLTRSLEATLETFVKDAVINEADENQDSPSAQKKRPPRIGVKTEGVWVGSKAARTASMYLPKSSAHEEDGELSRANEEDEMIWWAWDGKISGFSDW